MALPYLPSEEIQAMFENTASKLTKGSLKVIFYYSTYKLLAFINLSLSFLYLGVGWLHSKYLDKG